MEAEVKWEDADNSGIKYPHVYGVINIEAIQKILPFEKDKKGHWIKNQELMKFQNM